MTRAQRISAEGISATPGLSPTTFEAIASILRELTGIHLPPIPKNFVLVESRLQRLLSKNGVSTLDEYLALLRSRQPQILREFIIRMTTNTTRFFRESPHFETMKQYLSSRKRSDLRNLRVWCAASSTGQEPYTIAMVARECLPSPIPIKILGTDLDPEVIQKAMQAEYTDTEVEDVPKDLLNKYFTKEPSGLFKVTTQLRNIVFYGQVNLKSPSYPMKNLFDIVFCRNVLIYFERDESKRIVNQLCSHLKPGGLLFLGHSESGLMANPEMSLVSQAVYKKGASS